MSFGWPTDLLLWEFCHLSLEKCVVWIMSHLIWVNLMTFKHYITLNSPLMVHVYCIYCTVNNEIINNQGPVLVAELLLLGSFSHN